MDVDQQPPGASVVYDSASNVRLERVRINGSVLNRILTYDAANQLANVRINNVQVASYLYDHRGLRGRKTLNNPPAGVPAITLYTHDPNGQLFQEIAGSGPNAGQALVTYLWQDDVPAAIVLGPNTPGNPSGQDKLLYLEVDHLNTPRIARDEQKRVVWRWDSDAFGSTAPNEDPDGDGVKTTINLRFAGQYFDAESGLHCNWHRYYDPQTGRYTQPDPIGVEGGVNPYAYVEGNPTAQTDPTGLAPNGKNASCTKADLKVCDAKCGSRGKVEACYVQNVPRWKGYDPVTGKKDVEIQRIVNCACKEENSCPPERSLLDRLKDALSPPQVYDPLQDRMVPAAPGYPGMTPAPWWRMPPRFFPVP